MKIYPTLYNRSDGLILIRVAESKWSIRAMRGLAFFWNFTTRKWIPIHNLETSTSSDFHQPFECAMKVFENVPDPQISVSFEAVKA